MNLEKIPNGCDTLGMRSRFMNSTILQAFRKAAERRKGIPI